MKMLLQIGFVLTVTVLAWFSVPAAITAMCASILVALHGKASTLVEVSFGPLKAKLQRDITEAEALVTKLKQMALLQARSAMTTSVNTGRWPGNSAWIYENAKAIEASLRDMGVLEEELKHARSELVRYTISDMGNTVLGHSTVPLHMGEEASAEWKTIHHKGLSKTPDELEAFLIKWNRLTPDRQQRIADMRWMIEHGDIRDCDQYLRAHNSIDLA